MEFRIDLPSDVVLTGEAEKSVREQAFYLSDIISGIRFHREENGTPHLLIGTAVTELPSGLQERLIDVVRKTAASFKRVEEHIFAEHAGAITATADPHVQLAATGQIHETMPGVLNLQGDLLVLIRTLDRVFFQLAQTLGAIEQEYPTTVPLQSLVNNGYIASFPQHAIFAAPVASDLSHLQAVEQMCKQGKPGEIKNHVAQPAQVLVPAVCHHCFEALKGRKLARSEAIFTALAKAHRHEYKTAYGLERLQTFTIREIVYYGNEDFVQRTRQAIINYSDSTLRQWGARFRIISAGDPFFAIEAAKKRVFQSAFALKQELQMYLPYNEKWLAVGSFNRHRDSLVKAYQIRPFDESQALESGCVGFGYERMALAILAQFGCEPSRWPEPLQQISKWPFQTTS